MVAKLPASIAALNVAAEPLGAARLDCTHGLLLDQGQIVRCTKQRTVAREDFSEFYLLPYRIRVVRIRAHGLPALGVWQVQQFQ